MKIANETMLNNKSSARKNLYTIAVYAINRLKTLRLQNVDKSATILRLKPTTVSYDDFIASFVLIMDENIPDDVEISSSTLEDTQSLAHKSNYDTMNTLWNSQGVAISNGADSPPTRINLFVVVLVLASVACLSVFIADIIEIDFF